MEKVSYEPIEANAWYWVKEHASSQWECARAVDYCGLEGDPEFGWEFPMKDWIDQQQPAIIGPRIMPPEL